MKPIGRTRKCIDILALSIVLLIAVDRYYPAAMVGLGLGADTPVERNAGVDIVAAARSQIGITVKYAPSYGARLAPRRILRGQTPSPRADADAGSRI